ncbi:MerR family transcriptional regulator [Nocardioides sp. SYSU DS0651]|uniref:MerR family transcriptional regulator n=1 Tax=Nocardioides sp. SYSU DS0651 TaxID=3415955 RepID=UPI003F4B4030
MLLTIGQLASYAGVTVRAVRHYHARGLLPEPERDASGYRRYDAGSVVELIRIRTLAEAGVPLARVAELLAASPEEFAAAVAEVDRRMRAEVRRIQDNRAQLARLAAGDSLALPQPVTGYLDALRALGIDERLVGMERDAWILVAAHAPEHVEEWMVDKVATLEDPHVVRLYQLLGEALDWTAEDPRLEKVADHLDDLLTRDLEAHGGTLPEAEMDDSFAALLDSMIADHPVGRRLVELVQERGWKGWARIQRAPDAAPATRPVAPGSVWRM